MNLKNAAIGRQSNPDLPAKIIDTFNPYFWSKYPWRLRVPCRRLSSTGRTVTPKAGF